MDLQLKGRVALVTGGSKGIGASIVRQLASEGVKVAFCARESAALRALESELRASGCECLGLAVDVFAVAEISGCIATVVHAWGGLDILVNNVGGALRFGGFDELSDEDWMRAYEFNVLSMVRFTRAALPHLRASSLRRVINISSTSGLQPGLYNPHYSATKAAVVNLGKHLAGVLAKEKILVNTVAAGPIHSESWKENIKKVAADRGISEAAASNAVECEEAAKIPLGAIGEGGHIASVVALLASPVSSWTTGSCFHVNGGKMAVAL